MPALTGQSITIEINSVAYTGVVAYAELLPQNNVTQYVTLSTTVPTKNPPTFQLQVRGLQDWTDAVQDGFSRAMWLAAAAGTTVGFELVVQDGTWTGNIMPVFPNAGGEATAVLENDLTFEVVGIPSFT